ncbi:MULTISPECIES: PspA/IM30 family protein [Bacillus]|uniref:PspA/IM30 family protein n=1 Tax=Bacillus TaxID=1386 RepID=UPI000BB68751|nr:MULTISPECIES: PspA/IM30 family protein [Bacillus]
MTTLFTRIKNTIAADFHDALDKKEQKNPIALLNQYLRDCEKEVEKVQKLVERQQVLKDEFHKELKEANHFAEKRSHQAMVAENAGESELAEFATRESLQYKDRALQLEQSLQNIKKDLSDLEQKYEMMKHKLKDMYIKRMELMGRENVARANYKMNKVVESNDINSADAQFDDMDNYMTRLEHQVNTSYLQNTIDARIAQLEKEQKLVKTDSQIS